MIDEGGRAEVFSTDLRCFILALCFLFILSFSCGCLVSLYSAGVVPNADDNVTFIVRTVHSGCKHLTFLEGKQGGIIALCLKDTDLGTECQYTSSPNVCF